MLHHPSLHLFWYVCGNCNNKYSSPILFGGYGDFLMKSQNEKMAYLNAIESDVFNNFSREVKSNIKLSIKEIEKDNVIQKLFPITCDLAADGSQFEIVHKPRCPHCGKVQITSFGPTNPPVRVELDVEEVTHYRWLLLTEQERIAEIDLAIDQYLKTKKGDENYM